MFDYDAAMADPENPVFINVSMPEEIEEKNK
ncbi:hypothetical protein IGI49_005026 [Enterococcus sp. AZ071]